MPSQAMVSFAVLKAIADTTQKDFLENFVPFVAQCIRMSEDPVISSTMIQVSLRDEFGGLRIPQQAIDKILDRLEQRGFLRTENRTYVRNGERFDALTFERERTHFMQMHDQVLTKLTEFGNLRLNCGWSVGQSEAALQSFLSDGELLSDLVNGDLYTSHGEALDQGERFIVGSFVKHLSDSDPATFGFLETVAMGTMLAQAIFLPDPNPRMQDFQHSAIYFDTSFLMWALDCAGPARREPCIELLDMLRKTGAQLRCFRHTYSEIRGALENCASLLRDHRDMEGGPAGESLRYFRTQGLTYSDIVVKKDQLEDELAALNVVVIDSPAFGHEAMHQWVIDEAKLNRKLGDRIYYPRLEALDRDVKSISAIMVLRQGHAAFAIEQCHALFVTTNWRLAKETTEFFREEYASVRDAVPPCVSEQLLATYVWLNMPVQAPDLPRKRMIADCYAAMQPSEVLWRKFVRELERQEQRGKISPELCYSLRNTQVGAAALMEVTHGDEAKFTRGSVDEILQQAKDEMSKDVQRELEREKARLAAEQEARRRIESERDAAILATRARDVDLQTEQEARRDAERQLLEQAGAEKMRVVSLRTRISEEAQRIARRKFWTAAGLLIFLFAAADSGTALALPMSAAGKWLFWGAGVVGLLVVVAVVIKAYSYVTGQSIPSLLGRFESRAAKRAEASLLSRYGLRDDA